MSHLDYYAYQARARGIHGPQDIVRNAEERAYVYDLLIRRWLPPGPSSRIVDLACGHGSFLVWLKQRGYSNTMGVDSSHEQVALARSLGFAVTEADVPAWLEQQPTSSVDALIAIDFIEHISKDDFMRFLRGCQAALNDRGVLILRYPNGDSPFVGLNLFNDITHVWTYTTNCIRTLATMHGFTRVAFVDESSTIRDHRWIKVPLARASRALLKRFLQAASRERIQYWHSSIWALLEK